MLSAAMDDLADLPLFVSPFTAQIIVFDDLTVMLGVTTEKTDALSLVSCKTRVQSTRL
ncbi:hypothetical protein MITS9509_01066 [Synechococcus sp. MIT S9509]|uniref:hypothetical protein n=1 Tax=unclassified Synechococcus TaxID=2626047 RepID=UPI0007BBFB33|nr:MULTISPECIES: hypothetical protein [unclassified Synechococcus]KZR87214.1 hypothetical protein MITS9504_00630 [Synechococcus sp. MIT S9504]KZR92617.1 hypothetical protein MITS9509_01066 [Synechococcus sp. MIT S9509]